MSPKSPVTEPEAEFRALNEDGGNFTSAKLDLINAMMIDPRLRASDFRVAVCLIQFVNSETLQCNPSLQRVAVLLKLTTRAVQGCLASLKEAGWVDWSRGNRQKTNSYVFNTKNVAAMNDRRTSIDDGLREERMAHSLMNRFSRQNGATGTPVRLPTRTPVPLPIRTPVPRNTLWEHLAGTPKVGGMERKDAQTDEWQDERSEVEG